MAPGVSIAEQEVRLAVLFLHLVVEALEMIRIEDIAMKLKIKEGERRKVIKEERRREAMKGGQGKGMREGRREAMEKRLNLEGGIVNLREKVVSTQIKSLFKAPVVRNVVVFPIFPKNVKDIHSIMTLLVNFALSKVEHCITPPSSVGSNKVDIRPPSSYFPNFI